MDLLVDVPATGNYQMAFRYADAYDATRTLSVNGQLVEASLAFPATGGYSAYASITSTAQLTKGANTITVAYATAQGNSGYLNLDALQLTPQ